MKLFKDQFSLNFVHDDEEDSEAAEEYAEELIDILSPTDDQIMHQYHTQTGNTV